MKNVSRALCSTENSQQAFTLVELLAVVAAVLVLMGITFGVSRGVLNQQARTQAKAELAMIAQALEEFKLTYGDYPIISYDGDPTTGYVNAENLTNALTGYGKQGWETITNPDTSSSTFYKFIKVNAGDAKRFIDPSRLNYSTRDGFVPPVVDSTSGNLTTDSLLMDPWNQPYVYIYNKDLISWDNFGYVLFSKGPDRTADLGSIVSNGIVDQTTPNNIDNIHPNQ
jgi:prepilin-type N-terminal cleavage/methylation domain-containing protein